MAVFQDVAGEDAASLYDNVPVNGLVEDIPVVGVESENFTLHAPSVAGKGCASEIFVVSGWWVCVKVREYVILNRLSGIRINFAVRAVLKWPPMTTYLWQRIALNISEDAGGIGRFGGWAL